MKPVWVISRKQLPTNIPVVGTIAWYLLLDKIHAPAWLWGVWGTIWGIGMAGTIWRSCLQETVELKEVTSNNTGGKQ